MNDWALLVALWLLAFVVNAVVLAVKWVVEKIGVNTKVVVVFGVPALADTGAVVVGGHNTTCLFDDFNFLVVEFPSGKGLTCAGHPLLNAFQCVQHHTGPLIPAKVTIYFTAETG